MQRAVVGVEKSGVQQPAHTVSGRLEQARRWLAHPDRDDRGLGQQAIALIVTEGKKVCATILVLKNYVRKMERERHLPAC